MGRGAATGAAQTCNGKKVLKTNSSDIMSDPGRHQPQRPHTQGWTRAKQAPEAGHRENHS